MPEDENRNVWSLSPDGKVARCDADPDLEVVVTTTLRLEYWHCGILQGRCAQSDPYRRIQALIRHRAAEPAEIEAWKLSVMQLVADDSETFIAEPIPASAIGQEAA